MGTYAIFTVNQDEQPSFDGFERRSACCQSQSAKGAKRTSSPEAEVRVACDSLCRRNSELLPSSE